MNNKIYLIVVSMMTCTSALAAHIVTDTRLGSDLIARTHTYANSNGDLRIDEQGINVSAETSADAALTGQNATPSFTPGKINDSTIYQAKNNAIVMLEGKICRRLSADTPPPPGLGAQGANLGELSQQMNDAMKQAGAAMEQAMAQARKEGMTAEQERAMKQFTQPFLEQESIKPSGTLDIQKLGERVTVGKYTAEGYSVTDDSGQEKHRIWVVPTSKINGGSDVRKGMESMFKLYERYLEKMGGGALMDTGLTAMFQKEELIDTYPVRIEDMTSGEVTDVVDASSGGPDVEFYPECEERDMFGG